MAIKSLVSSAWQEIDTLKVPVSGAYQEADHANALVSGAWQEVWGSTKYTFNTITGVNTNTTLNGDGSITVTLAWAAQSGVGGNCYIMGEFEAGKSYTLTYTCDVSPDSMTMSVKPGSSEGERVKATLSAGSNTVTFTPSNDYEYVYLNFSASGYTSGRSTVNITNMAVNGSIVKLP